MMLMGGIAPSSPSTNGLHFPTNGGTKPQAVECWTSTADDVAAWLTRARPGDRFVYARGPTLVQGAAAALVGRLRDSKDVSPHTRRGADGVLEYVIIRNVPPKIARPRICDPHMMAVLVVLQDAAENGERCPSNEAIGEATDLSKFQVKAAIEKLALGNFITRTTCPTKGDARFRIIKVTATGCETRGPQ